MVWGWASERVGYDCEEQVDTTTDPSVMWIKTGGLKQKPLAFGEKPNPVGTWYFTSAHNCGTILDISYLARTRSIASLPGKIVFGRLIQPLFKNSFYHQEFFAVKRRAVFILGAKWKVLVRGWRSDCVVGGMETRFQWRKAHSRTAKCEAFHVAPRLFFMFLFFWFHSRFSNNV